MTNHRLGFVAGQNFEREEREFLGRDKSRAVSALNSSKNVPRVFHLKNAFSFENVFSSMIKVKQKRVIHKAVNCSLKPVSNVVLLPCRTQLLELNSTLARQWRDV